MNNLKGLLDDPISFSDNRGNLKILHELENFSLKRSFSKKNVFRGMHWQPEPYLQTKIIRVIQGEILDFIVDMSKKNKSIHHKMIKPEDDWQLIHPNFAHGFYSNEDTTFEYICIGAYSEEKEISFSIKEYLIANFEILNPEFSYKDKNNIPFSEI